MRIIHDGKLSVEDHDKNYTLTSTTTASYASMGSIVIRRFLKVLLHISETGGSESFYYKVDGSNDASNWYNLKSETSVAANGEEIETLTDAWAFIRVQVKDNSGHANAKVVCHMKR